MRSSRIVDGRRHLDEPPALKSRIRSLGGFVKKGRAHVRVNLKRSCDLAVAQDLNDYSRAHPLGGHQARGAMMSFRLGDRMPRLRRE